MKEMSQYIYNFILYTFRCVAQFGKTVRWTVCRERSESGMSAEYGKKCPKILTNSYYIHFGAWLSLGKQSSGLFAASKARAG